LSSFLPEFVTYIACYSLSLFLPEFVYINTEHAGNKSSQNVAKCMLFTRKQTKDNTQT